MRPVAPATTYSVFRVWRFFLAGDTVIGGSGAETRYLAEGADTVMAGDGDDWLVGEDGHDTLNGDAGADTLDGGSGNDSLNGGAGVDLVSYADNASGIVVNLATGLATGAGADTLASVENIVGSVHADNVTGNADANALSGGDGSDTLNGGDGNDTLDGGEGNDRLVGGNGNDLVSFAGSGAPIQASLQLLSATGQGTDVLSQIEHLAGSAYADSLVGNNSSNLLSGGGGADSLNGGNGNDTLNGGPGADQLHGGGNGLDTASYATAASGVLASLAAAAANNGEAAGDTYTSIENLEGSAFGDTLIGDSASNRILGNAGNDRLEGGLLYDTLIGGPGDDTLIAGDGGDLLEGGPGADSLDGSGATAHLVAECFNATAGVQALHVPFAGSAPAMTAILGGNVDYALETTAATMPQVRAGRLRAYGVSLKNGTALAEGVPPIARELNAPQFDVGAWVGLMMPRGTPAPIIERIAAAALDFQAQPDTRAKFTAVGAEMAPMGPAAMETLLQEQKAIYEGIIRRADIRLG